MRKVWIIIRILDTGIWTGYEFSVPLRASFYLSEKSAEHELLVTIMSSGKYTGELFELKEVYKAI